MRTTLLAALMLGAFPATTEAQMGKTRLECETQFGPGQPKDSESLTPEGIRYEIARADDPNNNQETFRFLYHQGATAIETETLAGDVVSIIYSRNFENLNGSPGTPFSQQEAQDILNQNRGMSNEQWESIPANEISEAPAGFLFWQLPDIPYEAQFDVVDNKIFKIRIRILRGAEGNSVLN
jgi:hypothetical protein